MQPRRGAYLLEEERRGVDEKKKERRERRRQENTHLKSRQPGNGTHRGQASLGGNGCTLMETTPPDDAGPGIEGVAVVVAAGADRLGKGATQGSIGGHGCEPQDDHEQLEGEDGPVVVGDVAGTRLLGDDGVEDDDESEDGLRIRG